MCMFVTCCVLFYCVCSAVLHAVVAGILARSKVLRPATSAQVFLGFPVSKSEC
jgi:hypothetical protein